MTNSNDNSPAETAVWEKAATPAHTGLTATNPIPRYQVSDEEAQVLGIDKGTDIITIAGKRYRILERAGGGGQSNVYKLEDERPGDIRNHFALKVFSGNRDHAERFYHKETRAFVRAARSLHHSNIVTVIEAEHYTPPTESPEATVSVKGETKQVDMSEKPFNPRILMEFYPLNLEQFMPRSEEERVKYVEGLMTGKVLEGMPHAWRLSLGLASAVAQLHKEGVIHRDIKPGNVYLTAETFEGIAKLGDAGMARLQDASQTSMTQGGTLRYMAPELFPGSTYPIDDKKTDVYSIGIALLQLFTGAILCPGESAKSAPELMKRVARRQILFDPEAPESTVNRSLVKTDVQTPSPRNNTLISRQDIWDLNPHLPGDLCDIILSCLREDPTQRPTAEKLEKDILFTRSVEEPEFHKRFLSLARHGEALHASDEAHAEEVAQLNQQHLTDMGRMSRRRWLQVAGTAAGTAALVTGIGKFRPEWLELTGINTADSWDKLMRTVWSPHYREQSEGKYDAESYATLIPTRIAQKRLEVDEIAFLLRSDEYLRGIGEADDALPGVDPAATNSMPSDARLLEAARIIRESSDMVRNRSSSKLDPALAYLALMQMHGKESTGEGSGKVDWKRLFWKRGYGDPTDRIENLKHAMDTMALNDSGVWGTLEEQQRQKLPVELTIKEGTFGATRQETLVPQDELTRCLVPGQLSEASSESSTNNVVTFVERVNGLMEGLRKYERDRQKEAEAAARREKERPKTLDPISPPPASPPQSFTSPKRRVEQS